jgi:hypothetical protein
MVISDEYDDHVVAHGFEFSSTIQQQNERGFQADDFDSAD